jgi:GTPase SAR1 family protein
MASFETTSYGSLLPDEEICDATKFGFDDYSKALASIVADKNLQTPFAIAIHGEWGSGKTSLMKTMAKELETPRDDYVKVKTIWFNAWEFERLNVPLWTVFLNRVIIELQEMTDDESVRSRLENIGKSIILISADVLLRKFANMTFKDLQENLEENVLNTIKKIDSLKEELQQSIETALEKDLQKRERVVIFIDDVDRCLPPQTVEIFESIKLFLSCKHCVFVIGVDKDQICKAFENKFGSKGPSGLLYVEKFIQLQFDLPRKTPIEVADFLRANASEQLKKSPKTIELISDFIEPNPRKIKRWLNSVLFLERLFRIKQEKLLVGSAEIDASIVSIWLFLKSFFPDFASFVEADLLLLNTAIRVASGQGTDDDKKRIGDFKIDKRLGEFLSLLKPEYSEKQLRDVVYLSRLTPPQQVSTLPPDIVRRIASMTKEELTNQISSLTEESILSLADRILDNLLDTDKIQSYQDASELCELLDTLFNQSRKDSTKAQLFGKIFEAIPKSYYVKEYFLSEMQAYTALPVIKEIVIEKDMLEKIVELFVGSSSYEDAKFTSAILVNFIDSLTSRQVENIAKASVENNQIYQSWGAQSNLKKIFPSHEDKLSEAQKLKISEKYYITF